MYQTLGLNCSKFLFEVFSPPTPIPLTELNSKGRGERAGRILATMGDSAETGCIGKVKAGHFHLQGAERI